MKNLSEYIKEASFEVFNKTKEWMEEIYDEFNEKYFNNELPDSRQIELDVLPLKGKRLGEQGFEEPWYINRSKIAYGQYIMLRKDYKGRTVDVNDIISELHPYIHLSTKFDATQLQWEDTLLHEMIHLWTHKDGYAPKQGHGPEFRKKCDEIRQIAKVKYDKDYELEIYAKNSNAYSLTEKETQKVIEKNKKKLAKTIGIYFELSTNHYPERFLFVSKNVFPKMLREIRKYDENIITGMWLSNDSYEKMCKQYGTFPVGRTYKYFDTKSYPKAINYMKIGENIVDLDYSNIYESMIDEAKKKYIKPEMDVIEITSDINIGEINLEDIVNALSDMNVEEIKGDKAIEDSAIDGTKS